MESLDLSAVTAHPELNDGPGSPGAHVPAGLGWAAFVWLSALVWFIVSDRVELLAYRVLGSPGRSPVRGRAAGR